MCAIGKDGKIQIRRAHQLPQQDGSTHVRQHPEHAAIAAAFQHRSSHIPYVHALNDCSMWVISVPPFSSDAWSQGKDMHHARQAWLLAHATRNAKRVEHVGHLVCKDIKHTIQVAGDQQMLGQKTITSESGSLHTLFSSNLLLVATYSPLLIQ